MASFFDDLTATRSNVLDRLSSGTPVDPGERDQINQIAASQAGEFRKGLRRAGYNMSSSMDATIGQFAEPFAPDFAARQFAKAEATHRNMPAGLEPEVRSFRDVDSLRSAGSYAASTLGEAAPTIGGIIAGGLAARLGLGTALRLGKTGKDVAQYAGGAAAMFPQETGETAMALRSNPEAMANTTPWERVGLSAGKGVVASAMESLVPTAVFANTVGGAAGRIAAGTAPALANVGRKAVGGALGEAATEGAQELSGQVAENLAAPGTGYDRERVLEAAVRGAISGGVLGGAGGTVQAARSNIDAAAEKTAEASQKGLNAAVERFDSIIRNPEQFGQDLTNTTLGALAEATDRARELGEAAGPAAAKGMDTVAALRQRLDVAVMDKLTPENRQKYVDLTKNFRLLHPSEYAILNEALATGDIDQINRAVGAASRKFADRVPRETIEGLKNLTDWAKKFGQGVTRAAREGRKAAQSYTDEDLEGYRGFLKNQFPDVLGTFDNLPRETSGQLTRVMLALRDNPQLLNPESPQLRDPGVLRKLALERGGVELEQLVEASREWRSSKLTAREREQAYEGQIRSNTDAITTGMERNLTPGVQAQLAEEGREVGPGATDAEDKFLRDEDGTPVNVEDTRLTPYNSLPQVQSLLAADAYNGSVIRDPKRRHDPRFVLPTTMTSEDITPEQIGQLLQGKDSAKGADGKYRGRAIPLAPETIQSRITPDGTGYQQDLNSNDITAQTGKPRADGGFKENFEGFVEEFDNSSRDLNIQGHRFLSALSSLVNDGIHIPRAEVPQELLQAWGMDPDGPDIRIKVNADIQNLPEDLQVQVGDKASTIGDLTGATRAARSLASQKALLESLGDNPYRYDGGLLSTAEQAFRARQTTTAAREGLFKYAARREKAAGRNLYKMPENMPEEVEVKHAIVNSYAQDYIQELSGRIAGSEKTRRDILNQQQLYNGLKDGLFEPEDVREFIAALREADTADENVDSAEAEARVWANGLDLQVDDSGDLLETLETFEADGMSEWELRNEAFGKEPGSERETIDEEFLARQYSPAGRETSMRKRGVNKQKDPEHLIKATPDDVQQAVEARQAETRAEREAKLDAIKAAFLAYSPIGHIDDFKKGPLKEAAAARARVMAAIYGEDVSPKEATFADFSKLVYTALGIEKGARHEMNVAVTEKITSEREDEPAPVVIEPVPAPVIKSARGQADSTERLTEAQKTIREMKAKREAQRQTEPQRPKFDALPAYIPSQKTMRYAGIGSRKTPKSMLVTMNKVAKILSDAGYTLLSGGAQGADSAFESGAGGKTQIFLARHATPETMQIAAEIHPAPYALSEYPMKLMARNTNQIFGAELDAPVDFVLAWTPDGAETTEERTRATGGTGQAIEMAARKGIPVINMAKPGWEDKLQALISQERQPTPTKPTTGGSLTRREGESNADFIRRMRSTPKDMETVSSSEQGGTVDQAAYIQRLLSGGEFRKTLSAQIVRNWAEKYLGGADIRVVEYNPRDADVLNYFGRTAAEDVPPGRYLPAGHHGENTPAILLIKRTANKETAGSRYSRMHVMAHEFGHAIEDMALANAPQEVKDSIDAAYKRAVTDTLENDGIVPAMLKASSAIRFIPDRNVNKTLTHPEAAVPRAMEQVQKGVASLNAAGKADYVLSKSEFFAEQFAKYAMRDPSIFDGASKATQGYLDRAIEGIKKFYHEVIQKLDRTTPEFDTFMKWLGTPAAERPAFPDYDPQQWDDRNPPPEEGTTAAPQQQSTFEEKRLEGSERQRAIYEKRLEEMTPEEKDAAIQELRQAVDIDARTGLGTNAKWLRTEKKRHIVSLDVDNLKVVNDNMGHPAGDQMLSLIGEALRSVGLANDAFHISGDEFYVHGGNKPILEKQLRQAQEYLADKVITGNGKEFTGPRFSFGMGQTIEAAETALQADKAAREAAGERTPRGEIPDRLRDVATPPPPPTEPPGNKPPPDDKARAKFIATVKRILGDRVNVVFDQTLPDGVGAEYVTAQGENLEDTYKALKKLGDDRRGLLREAEKVEAILKSPSNKTPADELPDPAALREAAKRVEADMQKYRADVALRGTIRVAAGMEAQAGLAEHEAFHAAFDFFFSDNNATDRRVVTTAFTRGVLSRRLIKYYEGNAEVLAVIDPANVDTFNAEEAAAYAFQVYLHDPGALQMGEQVEGIFNRFLAYLQRLVGYLTYEKRAQTIFNDLASGRRNERGISILRENPNIEKSMLSRSQDFVRAVGSGVMNLYDSVLSSSYSRLADSGNPAMAQIARLGYNQTGQAGQGMLQLERLKVTQLSNRLKEALHTLDANELYDLNQAMLLNEELTGRLGEAQKRLRAILKEAHDYQTAAGINLGFVQDYYPMIWDPEKVAADRQGFIDMLNEHPDELAELMKTADEVADSIIAYETRGHEFQGVFGKDGEPVADSSRRRTLGFIPVEDRAKYMSDDLIDTMAHYLNQSVRHAEYVRAYGQNGNRLKSLLGEITNTYGGSAADVELAKDYIDGLAGNKEVGMSRELKDIYGAAIVYQNVRLLPLSVFSSLVDPLGIGVRTNSATAVFDAFAYSIRNMFTDFRNKTNWTPEQWEQYAGDIGTVDMSGTVKSIDKIYTGVTLRGKTREINDGFFKWNLLNGLVKNHHIMATKHAQMYLRRSAEGMFGEKMSAENLEEMGLKQEDIVYDEKLGRIRTFSYEFLGYENAEQMEREASNEEIAEARAQADRIQQAIHKIVRQSLIQPSTAEQPGWMSNPYLAPIAHLKTFVFGFNATIIQRLLHEAQRGNYSPMYYAAAYVPGMIAADFIKGLAGNGGEEPEWKKNWTVGDYVGYGVERSGLLGTGQFFLDMNNDVTRGGSGWETLSGPTIEQAKDLMGALSAKTSEPTETWIRNALPANDLYDQWMKEN